MITIDGRIGGGQLLRTALSLAAVLGEPFEIEHVRANRPQPGLKPQHLAVTAAVADLCDAEVDGATRESSSLSFRPRTLRAGTARVDIGTAGSLTLLFDAVLPLATAIDAPLELAATGGTDGRWAPTIAYLQRVRLPTLARFGLDAEIDLHRTGYYPAGGGSATLRLRPSSVDPIDLVDRGALETVEIYSKASTPLAEREVAERQAETARTLLEARDIAAAVPRATYVATRSIGSSILLRAIYEGSLAGFDALGERGKPAEAVAEGATTEFFAFHGGTGAVDDHMADQILVFLALSGGAVRVPRLTAHVRSNLDAIARFGFDLRVDRADDGTAVVERRTAPNPDE